MKVEIEITENFQNPDGQYDFTSEECRSLIEKVLEAGEKGLPELPGVSEQDVFVCITDDREIRTVNKAYRNIDKATDVLSFPLLTEPVKTVRLPSALESVSAVWLLGAKPPKIVSWQLSPIISAPSLP